MPPRTVTVTGNIDEPVDDGLIEYMAAAPPDARSSFSGSGMPFASPEQAFERTPNRGKVTVSGSRREFTIKLVEPNSFYVGLGTTLVKPTLFVRYRSGGEPRTERLVLGEPIAYRTLTYQKEESTPREGPEFYQMASKVDARTQEQILNDSEYTVKYQDRFWGTKPPM